MMSLKVLVLAFLLTLGCTPKTEPDPSLNQQLNQAPLDPNRVGEVLETAGSNWWFGQGVGETALMVGTVVLFPPYIVAVLGNEALDLSGYERVTVSGLLPGEAGEAWSDAYNSVTSVPGQVNSAIADREFVTREVANENLGAAIKNAQVVTEPNTADQIPVNQVLANPDPTTRNSSIAGQTRISLRAPDTNQELRSSEP